mmetsp:Transcript_40447/g.49896  ORF Transcript_40447/g.49896 Transcript_40447/m.49896 type:complete len:112 (+) Transcript_40447:104-439(+)
MQSIIIILAGFIGIMNAVTDCGSTLYQRILIDIALMDEADLFNPCCVKHDTCYGQCNGKKHCDDKFEDCLEDKCLESMHHGNNIFTCWAKAKASAWAVDKFGDDAYEDAGC